MGLNIDLKKYCGRVVIDKGLSNYKAFGISSPSCARTTDGALLLKGKSIDSFNFVDHPWLVVDMAGTKLLGFGCDCHKVRQERVICEHCVSLCFSWMDQVPDYIFAEEQLQQAFPNIQVVPVPAFTVVVPQPQTPVIEVTKPLVQEPEASEKEAEEATEALPAAEPQPEPEPAPEPEPQPEPAPEPFEPRSMEIHLGHTPDGEPLNWYPNDTEKVFHTNVGVIGTMGTGKTQFSKSLLTQLYRNQKNNYDGSPLGILIFDYKGDYNETKKDFVEVTRARILKPYKLPYNPLALNPGKSFKPLLPTHTANEFKDTISQIYGLGPKQEQLLLECILKAYRKQGIEPADPLTWSKRAPTIDQVYQIFADETIGRPADKLTTAMSKLQEFCLFEPDQKIAVPIGDLLKGVTVVDMSGYDSDIQSTIVAITLNQFYAWMQAQGSSETDGSFRQLRCFVMVDEADTFMREDFPALRRIMKEGREFGVGVILSTQSLSHYVSGEDDYSRYVLTWVVHNVSDLKQRDVEYVFRLQPKSPEITKNYAIIKGLQKHQSVAKLGSDMPIVMHNKAFYQLYREIKETGV